MTKQTFALVTCLLLSSFGHSAVILNSFTADYSNGETLTMIFDGTVYGDDDYIEITSNDIPNPALGVTMSDMSGPVYSVGAWSFLLDLQLGVVAELEWSVAGLGSLGWTTLDETGAYNRSGNSSLSAVWLDATYGVADVPIPAAGWLFMTALAGLVGKEHRARQSAD